MVGTHGFLKISLDVIYLGTHHIQNIHGIQFT